MTKKWKFMFLTGFSLLLLILAGSIIFFINNYRILKLAEFSVDFPDASFLTAKLYVYNKTEYLLVVTKRETHETQGFWLGFYDKDNFVGIASFNRSKYFPFLNYALTGLHSSIEPVSLMGRFDADINFVQGRIFIFVKGVHPEAKDWMFENEAKKCFIYKQKIVLIKY